MLKDAIEETVPEPLQSIITWRPPYSGLFNINISYNKKESSLFIYHSDIIMWLSSNVCSRIQ